ncbi:H-NS family histone-like protein [Zophobihabitans entericus]|uniref:DNA-binding protein n=1 Tax=Zophobihabitans entericus TaxID=1635327 RepID=A0A6G9IE60_9GAMM|nr:H-NS family nucleoid-associated regulatory protein [Zophobihabitans entericus]QIQ22099.1 H-NS histone family protein [Zophobihabitans entericus]
MAIKPQKEILLTNNLRKIRSQVRKVPTSLLDQLLTKFQQVVNERHESDKQAQKALAEHNKKVEKYLTMMHSDGVNINDLVIGSTFPAFKKPRRTRKTHGPKYQYQNPAGELKTWNGQGRMPKPIRVAIEKKQKMLNDFLIK